MAAKQISRKIDFVLVNNIALILQLLRSKQELNIQKFETLCAETYNRNYTVFGGPSPTRGCCSYG
ncbi:hypothetical protein TSAR_008024 [Trichomalopsis sarcophagae]|uniref:Uncharacterized protein n=1 Tax=Trichomalopsis sarcophagae TaxID=543379 RepID=A0A232FNX7_9HYME|nr:hypothetical protein TSAR_008024 [Trichomalopsis sarcophagae]